MKELKLQKDKGFALVDDEDYERLRQYKWHLQHGYARRRGTMVNYVLSKAIYLHIEVMGFPDSGIDHKDGNKLNCQKDNLRLCTQKNNSRNRSKGRRITGSVYKGVWWSSRDQRWVAEIRVDNKKIYLGMKRSEEEAALLYNDAAVDYFGEYAKLNIIKD